MIITLDAACTHQIDDIGGKSAALMQLLRYGAPVPRGFVVTPDADVAAAGSDIMQAYAAMGCEYVAVRSSAIGEDSKARSWAGQFESYLYVCGPDIIRRIADCRGSGVTARARAYDAVGSAMPIAVIVQQMVDCSVAGVMFTANPITRDKDEAVIEAVYGLGEQLVQGITTPDNFVMSKASRTVVRQTIARKEVAYVGGVSGIRELRVDATMQHQPALNPAQLCELASIGAHLESEFGYPLDIEYGYANNTLYILQARPITTLMEKEHHE